MTEQIVEPISLEGSYTISDVMELLQLKRELVGALCEQGVIPSMRLGGRRIRIPKARFFAWQNGLKNPDSLEELLRNALSGIDRFPRNDIH